MTKQLTAHAPRTRSTRARHRIAACAAALGILAGSSVAMVATAPSAFAGPAPVQFGFVPMPADQFQLVMEHINSGADTTIDFTVGITSAAAGAVITYDEWEDGYEADLANPVQSTTKVFGDSNIGNGNASTICAECTGDTIPQGAVLVGRNSITTPRDTAQIRYDGRDAVASTRGFALTAGGFSTPLGSVLSGSVSAFDTSTYGTDYIVPVGENTPVPALTSNAFQYTGAVVMAAQDATTVNVDKDGNGTTDQTQTINKGEVVFVDGLLQQGAHITSTKPVQVHLATGDKTANYESRWFTLFPTPLLTSDYLSPVGSNLDNERTIIYLFNPNASTITVTPTCGSCSGTISIPAHTSASFATPLGEAVRFASVGSEPFLGVGGGGSQSGALPGSVGDGSATHDWGFTLIPTRLLTTQAVLGWAPGNSANPPSSAVGGGHEDDNPVWITTLTATTLHVDYDGNPATGAIASADCFGARHDADIAVGALESTRIFDATDSDMTGARIYTCDGTKIAGAWGEDPENAPPGAPGFDAGYTLIPSTTMIVDKTASVLTDANGDGKASPGDTLTYDVSIADAGALAFTNVSVADALPAGTTYVPGSTVFDNGSTVTPIGDDSTPPAASAFPLDESGAALPDIVAGSTVHVRYEIHIDNPFQEGTSLTNSATITADEATASDTNVVQLTTADLSLTKTQTGSPVHVGDNAVFHLTVSNAGPDTATGVEVTDLLPSDATYVSDTASQGSYDDGSGLWNVGTLASGASATLNITATVDDTSVTNFAEITSATAADPDSQPAENTLDSGTPPDQDDEGSVTVTTTQPSADLSLTKTQTGSPTFVGDTAVFHLTVSNAGPDSATGVEVVDLFPSDATYVSDVASQGSYNDTTGYWTVGTLANGASATLDITVTVDDISVTNYAEVSASDTFDPDSQPAENGLPPDQDDEDSATVSTTVQTSDLSLTKTQTGSPVHVGDDAVFHLTVSNAGPDTATGVEVTDLLPSDATYVSDTASQGSYDDGSGLWNVGTLANGASATIDITATVDDTSVTNYAEVSAADDFDPDSEPAENTLDSGTPPDQDDEGSATVTTTVEAADLSLTKTQTGSPVYVGDNAVFHLTVSNAGPDTATGVEVTDLLPGDATYVSDTASQGSYDDGSGLWTVGSLASGASATLDITVTVDDTSVTNYAEVSAADIFDPDSEPAENSLDGSTPPDQDDEDSAVVTTIIRPTGVIGDTVWHDHDGDGTRDAGEPGIANVDVALRWAGPDDTFGTGDDVVGTDTTDANGKWSFSGLSAGRYRVTVATATLPDNAYLPSYDLDGTSTANRAELTLAADQVRNDADFGYSGGATVGDTVFNDANGNNTPDPGEGLSGVKVQVTEAGPDHQMGTADDIVHTVTTNANGVWSVHELAPGPIKVRVVESTLPSGLINTYDPDGGHDGVSEFVLAEGVNNLAQDFAYSEPATFGDHVWMDTNGNGIVDPGEPGVSGVTVTLKLDTDGDGIYETTIGTRVTDANGDYVFNGLRFGNYRAVIDTSTAPDGSNLTTPDHVDVTLSPGEISDLGDFGLEPGTLPFTGTSIEWLLRFGLVLLAFGPLVARFGRRRVSILARR